MIRLVISVALVSVLAVWAPPAASSAADSVEALSTARGLVERAAQGEGPRDELIRSARLALESAPEIAANEWLREPLQTSPPNLDDARARLIAAQAAIELPAIAPRDSVTARISLDGILSNPPIKGWSWLNLVPGWLLPLLLLLEPIATAIWNAVRWPFDRFLELLSWLLRGTVNSVAIIAIGGGIALGLGLLLRRGLHSSIVAQSEIPEAGAQLPPTSGEALAIAHHHAQRQQFREACHYVFLSTLLWIEEHDLEGFKPAATNREYLAQVAAHPLVARALRPVVSRFDRLWYGQDHVSESDYRDLLALADRLRAAVG